MMTLIIRFIRGGSLTYYADIYIVIYRYIGARNALNLGLLSRQYPDGIILTINLILFIITSTINPIGFRPARIHPQ